MEVAFRGGSLSEISHSDTIIASDSKVIACAGSLRHLGAQRRGNGDNVHVTATIMDGHLLAHAQVILVSSQLVAHLLDRKTAPKERTCLTVLREDQISILQCGCCADARGLLTQLGHVERDPGLPLRGIVHLISLIDGDHLVVHVQQELVR